MYPEYNTNPYYGISDYNYRGDYNYRSANQPNTYDDEIITLNQAIESIRQSVKDEREDELFYDNLLEQATTQKEKDIITSIRDDERKHNRILRDLYYNFTGQMIQQDISNASIDTSLTYKENLEKALFGELNAVIKYRKIMATMPSGNSYTLLMSIMTDELRHASKYNFLIHTAG
jgi:rubrerythrin